MKVKEFTDAIVKEWQVYFPGCAVGVVLSRLGKRGSIIFKLQSVKIGSTRLEVMNDVLSFGVDCDECYDLKTDEMDGGFEINIMDKIFFVESPDHRAYGKERLKVQKTTANSPEDAIKKLGVMFKKVKDQLKVYPKEKHLGSLKTMFESSSIKGTLKEIYEGL